jgi:hypothetical protein
MVYNPATDKLLTTNQLVFDESFFPYRKENFIKQLDEADNAIDILFKESSPHHVACIRPEGISYEVHQGSHGVDI